METLSTDTTCISEATPLLYNNTKTTNSRIKYVFAIKYTYLFALIVFIFLCGIAIYYTNESINKQRTSHNINNYLTANDNATYMYQNIEAHSVFELKSNRKRRRRPTNAPTCNPTHIPTVKPTQYPITNAPTTYSPTHIPSLSPTFNPSLLPSHSPTHNPSIYPTINPSNAPTNIPLNTPTHTPSVKPSNNPTHNPSIYPTINPSNAPTNIPSNTPTHTPSIIPSYAPSYTPSYTPTKVPTMKPTHMPNTKPTSKPTNLSTHMPTYTSTPNMQTTALTTALTTMKILRFDIEIEIIVNSTFTNIDHIHSIKDTINDLIDNLNLNSPYTINVNISTINSTVYIYTIHVKTNDENDKNIIVNYMSGHQFEQDIKNLLEEDHLEVVVGSIDNNENINNKNSWSDISSWTWKRYLLLIFLLVLIIGIILYFVIDWKKCMTRCINDSSNEEYDENEWSVAETRNVSYTD